MIEPLQNALPVRLLIAQGQDTLFVRLSPDVLATLVAAASSQLDDADVDTNASSSSFSRREWRWTPPTAGDSVSFLPLEMLVGERTIYASYNGGRIILAEESSSMEAIQVPDALLSHASSSSSLDGSRRQVKVRALGKVRYATRVQVDPLTTEDWELLQVHAELLEDGAFLKQISLVYRDQRLRLSLPTARMAAAKQRDTIQVTVQDISTTVEMPSSPWPELLDEDNAGSTAHDEEDYVALLTRDTEIVITPKPRSKEDMFDPSSWSEPLQVIPGALDVQKETSAEFQDRLLDLAPLHAPPPGCILVHPNSIAWHPLVIGSEWVQVSSADNSAEGKVVMARLLTSIDLPENYTVLHPCLRWDLGLPLFWGHIQVRPCVVHSESVSLQEIELRKVSLKCSSGRQWYYPDMHDRNVQPINDELNKPLDTHLQLPVGSIVALSMEPSQSEGPSKEVLYRIVPRTSTADDLKGKVVSLQPEDMAALKSLAAEALSEDVDELERSSTDFLASTLPRPVFDSTLDALGSFFCDLRRNFPFLGILSGSTGSGKTHTALILGAVARMEHHRATLYLDCKRLQDSTTTIVQILSELDEIFASACKAKRCLVILDDLDRITPNLLGGNEGDPGARAQGANPTAIDQSKLISDRILQLLEATNLRDSSVSVIATCAGATALNTSLCEDQKTANIPTLKTGERLQLFVHMLRALKLTSVAPLSEAVFGQPTEGFRPRDLEKVAARVRRYFDVHGEASSLEEATDSILQEFISLSHMGLDKPRTKAGLSWGEIGGLFNVKKKLEATLINPMKYRAIYERAKIRLPTGVLLLGPTGCGKTALVPALAKMCKFPLISCKGPEILDKYIGASEAKIRELFKRAASVAPSILFLDELDALAPRRGSDHTGVTDRVVNQLLTFLDGVEDTSNATVYVIGASSRPDKIDPALLRPGRLEQHLFVGPPESDEEWKDLFHQIASGWSLSPLCRKHFFAERGTEELLAIVKKNPLFCPADMKAAMDTAQLNAVHRTLSTTKAEDISHIDIEVEDLRRALLSMRPCLNRDDARMLAEIYHPKGRKPNTTARQQELKTTLR